MAGFFKILWRINAVLAFVAALGAITFLTLFSKERINRPLLSYLLPAQAEAAVQAPKLSYNYMIEPDLMLSASTDSADFELYRLVRWGTVEGKPAPQAASAMVNVLIVDKNTKANSWLFKGFDQVILSQEPMLTGHWYYHEPQVDDDIPVELIVLRVADADTNGDGILNAADRQSLYAIRLKAAPPEKFLSADKFYFTRQEGKQFLVGYSDQGHAYLATYSLPEFQQLSKTEITGMPQ